MLSALSVGFQETVPNVPIRGEGTATIPVQDGWNIVSNPLALDVDWSQVQAASDLGAPLYRWAGGDVLEIDLRSVFSSPSETEVSFSVSSSNPDAATVSLQNALLSVTPVEGGKATITATAENEAGTAEDTFVVTVFADPPGRP